MAKKYTQAEWARIQSSLPEEDRIPYEQSPDAAPDLSGEGLDEVGSIDGKVVVRIDPKYFRPAEVELLLGNSEKAYNELGWFPKYSTSETLREMVLSDYKTYNNTYNNN